MKYFKWKEFECSCGCNTPNNPVEKHMHTGFLQVLENARYISECQYIINSGYRCPTYNMSIGSKPTSSHIKGLAVDILVPNSTIRWQILYGLFLSNFKRMGIGEDFIHVDADPNKPPKVVWLY